MSGPRVLGEFDELCLLEGSVLQMRGTYRTLMVDLTVDGVRKLLSKKENLENED